MKLCRWLGDTFLGQFFFRTLGHQFDESTWRRQYVERRCRCGKVEHAHRTFDRRDASGDTYYWHDGPAP